jgi:hypothetical protein
LRVVKCNLPFIFFFFFASTMVKFLIKKSLIPKDLSSIQNKHDNYNSKPNSFIPQDSCIITFFFLFFSSFVINTLEKIPGAATGGKRGLCCFV